jgi:hypothetical protein
MFTVREQLPKKFGHRRTGCERESAPFTERWLDGGRAGVTEHPARYVGITGVVRKRFEMPGTDGQHPVAVVFEETPVEAKHEVFRRCPGEVLIQPIGAGGNDGGVVYIRRCSQRALVLEKVGEGGGRSFRP